MRKCNNCGSEMNCSCQVRIASNQVQVCSKCIASYEASLKNGKFGINSSLVRAELNKN